MIARKADLDDVPRLLEMARQMHAETRYAKLSYSEAKVRDTLVWLILAPNGILVMTDNGFLAGTVEDYWFGDDRHAQEFLLYVLPEKRGNGDAIKLVEAYVQRAKELGAKDIHIEDTTTVHPERNDKFFTRMNFQRVGGNFLMEVH